MSNPDATPEEQAAISEIARSVMRKLAAGQTAEEVARELQVGGWQKSTAEALVEHVQEDWRQIEAAPQANAGLYLQVKYPEMRPPGAAPSLYTVHGIGTGFYGSRDIDRPTGTYVKTQCFCVFFLPILALKAYRVASRGAGWTLIGRVPLSRFAKIWNVLVPCAVLAAIGVGMLSDYLDSPAYVAGRKLARADEAAAAGKLLDASRLYREVADSGTEYAAAARQRCVKLVERPEIDGLPSRDVSQILRIASEFAGPPGEKDVFQAGMTWVEHHPQADHGEVFGLLDQLADLRGADLRGIAATRRQILEKLVAADPQDVALAAEMAMALEEEASAEGGQKGGADTTARIVKLLAPFRDKLADGDGARLLGQALAAQGKFDESSALLGPYLDKHLDAFHQAEQAYEDAIERVSNRVRIQLQNGTAPGFDFQKANAASEDQRRAQALEYLNRQIREDAAVEAARDARAKLAMVVPAALDLGMARLQRAQAMKDPVARSAELGQAEKTFEAIRDTAGESDKYLLRHGQVYYWMGKQTEGRHEFDKLLDNHQRDVESLSGLAEVLRNLGAFAEARKLMEEAYEKAPSGKERQGIAQLRAITSTGLDDKIHWLELCNAGDINVKALLAEARGAQAEREGKDDDAAVRYREAVALYDQQPRNASSLNNGALASLALFEISGDRQALENCTQRLDQAVRLSPADSVLLANAADLTLRAAVQDLAGAKLNLRELQMSGSIAALYYLAGDQKALEAIRRTAREHAGLRRGLAYLDRVNVLSPKNVSDNESALAVYGFLRDREALQRLARQVADNQPDVEEGNTRTLKFYKYQDEDFSKEKMKARIARAEALVTRLGARDKGPAYAAAVDGLVNLKLSLAEDDGFDADEIVRLAEDAHRAAPSMATYGRLIKALMTRAGRKLAAQYPQYAQATRGTGRAVSASSAVALAMERKDALGKSAREDKDVKRAVALVAVRAEAFPEARTYWDWAVLGIAGPDRADLRAKCLLPDELEPVERQIGRALSPIDPDDAFETYWRRRAAGDATSPKALDQLVKLGVPLPVGLIEAGAGKK